MSDVIFQISDYSFFISNFRAHMSVLKFQVLEFRFQISDFMIGTQVWYPAAGETGLLMLGEPLPDTGEPLAGTQGNRAGPPVVPAL